MENVRVKKPGRMSGRGEKLSRDDVLFNENVREMSEKSVRSPCMITSISMRTKTYILLAQPAELKSMNIYCVTNRIFIVTVIVNVSDLLANVNSRSRSLYVVVRPSVVCLSSVVCRLSVTFVHPTQAIEIFGNVSSPFNLLAIY